uniref:Uncharacterized protein LOC104223776 n=1 Tax=Nicotiana sylvestris TaxID=4096 RepID=A0A1U7W8P5_NICSY|nr:PREDICTED: uncharacterized protein LOC104223776 [Nicotiana sylvestris]
MSGTKPDIQMEAIKYPDIVEACKSTIEDLDPVQLDDTGSTKKAYVGHNLSRPGIPRDIATHRLNVDPLYPLKQMHTLRYVSRRLSRSYGKTLYAVLASPKKLVASTDLSSSEKEQLRFSKNGTSNEYSPRRNTLPPMKLEDAKRLWPELLPEVLWAYRTTPKTSTGETPYSLVYRTDAVIPVKVGEPSLRYSRESGPSNDEIRL